jgi:hypothetical protein
MSEQSDNDLDWDEGEKNKPAAEETTEGQGAEAGEALAKGLEDAASGATDAQEAAIEEEGEVAGPADPDPPAEAEKPPSSYVALVQREDGTWVALDGPVAGHGQVEARAAALDRLEGGEPIEGVPSNPRVGLVPARSWEPRRRRQKMVDTWE